MSDTRSPTIAVAVAFSPRFIQVLAEAKRIRDRLGANLNLIYVGKRDLETTKKFTTVLQEIDLPRDTAIHYHQGDPAGAILAAVAANNVDLIVAGALEKEVVLKPFLGNVARRLVRDATCSVMLFTKPERDPQPLRRIVFMAEYSEHGRRALQKAVKLAAIEGSEKLYVIRVYTSFDQARATRRRRKLDPKDTSVARTLDEEEGALEQFIDGAGVTEVPIEARCIRGNTGYAAADFVQSVEANLLVVPLEPAVSKLPNHIAWVTDTIPCNLWLIR
ncbi:MAG: universal stress protein [Chthoniobacterales bacterium]